MIDRIQLLFADSADLMTYRMHNGEMSIEVAYIVRITKRREKSC